MFRDKFHITLYDKKLHAETRKFMDNYTIQNVIVPPHNPIKTLIDSKKRICRFCKQKSPDVTFKKDAHIIPHLLGNKYLISDFECDTCNKIFNLYETQLANYLGISRTLLKVKGKNGIPNFISPKNSTSAKKEQFYNIKDAIILSSPKYDFDPKTCILSVEYEKNPYKPIQIFKTFLKIAMCMMKEEDLERYSINLNLLLTNKFDSYCEGNPLFSLYKTITPKQYSPIGILFRKKTLTLKLATHILVCFFGNHMYQCIIPNNKNDIELYDNGFEGILMPPFHFDENYIETKNLVLTNEDMSSSELKREMEILTFKFDAKAFNNLIGYDPITNTYLDRKFDPTSIAKMIMIDNGQVINVS